jgi:uncharacterized protein CbrC (UPF0167 family)
MIASIIPHCTVVVAQNPESATLADHVSSQLAVAVASVGGEWSIVRLRWLKHCDDIPTTLVGQVGVRSVPVHQNNNLFG